MAASLGMTALRGLAAASAAAAALALASCSDGGPSLPSLATGSASSEAMPGTTPDLREGGNPFQDNTAQALSGRTVIANPTVAEIMQPPSSLPEMALGRPDAPVTFIKYAS